MTGEIGYSFYFGSWPGSSEPPQQQKVRASIMDTQSHTSGSGKLLLKVFVGFVALVVLVVGFLVANYFSINGADVRDRNDFVKAEKDRKVVLDKLWQVLQGANGVDKRQQQMAYDLIVGGMAAQAEAGGGSFATSTSFAEIEVPEETKTRLLTLIESEWAGFETAQTALTSLESDINTRVQHPWSSLFIKNTELVDAKIIASAQTHQEADSGVMERNTSDLFENDPPLNTNE